MKYTKIIARKKGHSSLKENTQMSVVRELRSKNKLVNSPYMTDRSSPLNANQKGGCNNDPYELNIEDEVTVGKKINKKTSGLKKTVLSTKDSKTKKSSGHKIKSTSTPVLQQSNDSSSVTPEVTPILATKPFNDSSPNSRSFITPQLARSVRKRECNGSGLKSLSKQLNYSSLIDSGIGLSPPPAKKTLTETLEAWSVKENLSTKALCSKENIIATKTNENLKEVVGKNILQENSNLSTCNNVKQFERVKNSEHLTSIDSCFGFDSLDSPQISPINKMNKRKMVATSSLSESSKISPLNIKNKRKMVTKSTYRLGSLTPDLSQGKQSKDDCLSMPQESPKSIPSSPLSLFTEEVVPSETECLKVNKSSIKSYKSSGKKLKRQSVSKIDEWASNFNNEIEKIEQFDLYME